MWDVNKLVRGNLTAHITVHFSQWGYTASMQDPELTIMHNYKSLQIVAIAYDDTLNSLIVWATICSYITQKRQTTSMHIKEHEVAYFDPKIMISIERYIDMLIKWKPTLVGLFNP